MARPPDSSPEQISAFGEALTEEAAARGKRQADVRRALEFLGEHPHQTTVSNWFAGKVEPTRPQVRLLEEALYLAPGTLSRHLGWLPVEAVPASNVREAIEGDQDLSPEQREDLADQYRAMVERTRVRRSQRRRSAAQ